MQPEDRLDALLSALRQPEREAATGSTTAILPPASADAELAPLLRAASEVSTLRAAAPDPAFARALRERMLVRSAQIHVDGVSSSPLSTPSPVHGWRAPRPRPARSRAPGWAALAAAVVLTVSLGTFTAAAYAGPASPLFGLHRLEQGIRVAVANDSASRARLHMQYARQWLAALRGAATQRDGNGGFQSALSAMLQENAATDRDAAQVTDSATRAAVLSARDALWSDEGAGLRAALGQVGWDDRVAATNALGQLGESVLQVTQVRASMQQAGVQVTVEGAGFQLGAQLVLNGRPVGQVVSTTPAELVVQLSRGDFSQALTSLGVGNPDGTAALAPTSELGSLSARGPDPTETAGDESQQATPGTDGHGNGKGQVTPTPGSHDHGGGDSGTPTPQTTRTGD